MASRNPFMDEPEDDGYSFGSNKANRDMGGYDKFGPLPNKDGTGGSDLPPAYGEPPSRYELLQQQKQNSMNRQLESTQRCLASIYDSEQTGIATAEELVRQGEQLDNVETKVDKINADTKISQRHLNGIKSIFGGIKNWWNGDGKKDESPAPPSRDRTDSRLNQALAKDRESSSSGMHPGLRVRGFYDEDIVEFGEERSAGGASGGPAPRGGNTLGGPAKAPSYQEATGAQQAAYTSKTDGWKEYEGNLNKNLGLMSDGMAQLKNLALGLGDEIEAQNDQLDRIMPKTERADIKIRDQNRQMKQILGK